MDICNITAITYKKRSFAYNGIPFEQKFLQKFTSKSDFNMKTFKCDNVLTVREKY